MIINHLLIIWLAFAALFTRSDVPEYKGGQNNLYSFISRSIIYPEFSKFNCLQGTIQISFILNRKGKIVRSKVEKGLGVDLDDEALRVVRLTSGKWIVPADFDTTQYLTIPINFSLKEYSCEGRSGDEIREAIASYKAREDLTLAITNYYSRKGSANTNGDDELKILSLKDQLGYDDKFIARVLRQGQQKLKQGDKEGACEDFNFIKNLGSDKADKFIAAHCK